MRRKRGSHSRGAGTHACCAGTLAGARPAIMLGRRDQASFDWVVFDVGYDVLQFEGVAGPMIVRFGFPEWLTCAGFHEASRRDLWSQQHVYMVGHDHVGSEVIVAEFYASVQGAYYELRNFRLSQVHWAASRGVQMAVDPCECLPGAQSGWWVQRPAARLLADAGEGVSGGASR